MKVQWNHFLMLACMYPAQAQVGCQFPNKGPSNTCVGKELSPCCPQTYPFTELQKRSSLVTDELISQVARGHAAPGVVPFQIAAPFTISGADKLAVGLVVHRIFEVNQRLRTFKMKYTLISIWRDCRTVSNCTYLKFDDKHPEFRNFWTPQFSIPELATFEAQMQSTRLSIDPDGLVEYASDHVSTISCDFDFDKFPFDKHDCTFTLSTPLVSWLEVNWDTTFGKAGVIFDNVGAHGEWGMSELGSHGEWGMSEFWTEEVMVKGSSYARNETNAARAHVTFKRVADVQIRSYVIPTMCFWFSSWCGLFIDCSAVPARAALGVVPLLILANKMSALTASLPPMTSTCVLERYMLYNMALMALHLFEFALVNMSMRLQRERKQVNDDEEANPDARHSVSQQAVQWRDTLIMRYMNRQLNVHTRWVSLLIFAIINIIVFTGN